jgi:hypothetical protein
MPRDWRNPAGPTRVNGDVLSCTLQAARIGEDHLNVISKSQKSGEDHKSGFLNV